MNNRSKSSQFFTFDRDVSIISHYRKKYFFITLYYSESSFYKSINKLLCSKIVILLFFWPVHKVEILTDRKCWFRQTKALWRLLKIPRPPIFKFITSRFLISHNTNCMLYCFCIYDEYWWGSKFGHVYETIFSWFQSSYRMANICVTEKYYWITLNRLVIVRSINNLDTVWFRFWHPQPSLNMWSSFIYIYFSM